MREARWGSSDSRSLRWLWPHISSHHKGGKTLGQTQCAPNRPRRQPTGQTQHAGGPPATPESPLIPAESGAPTLIPQGLGLPLIKGSRCVGAVAEREEGEVCQTVVETAYTEAWAHGGRRDRGALHSDPGLSCKQLRARRAPAPPRRVPGTGPGPPLTMVVMSLEKKLPSTGGWLAMGQNSGYKGKCCF